MTFTVTYRSADGALREARIEAANRAECFAQLKARDIAPMSVREGVPKGKSADSQKGRRMPPRNAVAASGKHPSGRRAVLYVVCVLFAIGGVAWWWWRLPRPVTLPEPEAPKKPSLVKEIQTSTNLASSAAQEIPAGNEIVAPVRGGETNEAPASLAATNTPKASGKKFRIVRHPNSQKKSLFKEKSDQRISRLLSVEPGGFLVGTFSYKGFKEQFLRSLRTPIVVTEEDSPKDAAIKRAVLETRADLKARLDAGEDIEQVMEETEKELRRLSNYRVELVRQINRDKREGKFSAEDMKDYVEAANVLLKEKGIKPLAHPEMFYRNVKVHETTSGNEGQKD